MAAPSKTYLTDQYEPTNETLWLAVLDVAQGKKREMTLGDRTIHAPNNGGGYKPWPNPMGSAWAVKQYKGFGGAFRKRASQIDPLPLMAKGAVMVTKTATDQHTRMQKFQKLGLVCSTAAGERCYWDLTAKGVRIVQAMIRRNQG